MSQLSLVVGVFVLASGLWPQPSPTAAPPTGQLRFVRGTVAASSPDSLTVQMRDKTVTLSLDASTRLIAAAAVGEGAEAPAVSTAVGSVIEVHYIDRKPDPRAVFVLGGMPGTTPASKRPGRSYTGVISRVKSSDVSITVDTKRRGVKMDKRTKLIGVDGLSLAVGWKAVGGQLLAGDLVLLTYDEQSDDMYSGDLYLPGSHQRALEIRKLGN